MKVAIVNCQLGNVGSVRRALEDLGAQVTVCDRPEDLVGAQPIVLPGVGSFAEGMQRLRNAGWVDRIQSAAGDGVPVLGICLGMQLLFTRGEEGGDAEGLGLIDGVVRHLSDLGCELRVPHVGWNDVAFDVADPLLRAIEPSADFYFVHSYAATCSDVADVLCTADYGVEFCAAVRRSNVVGTQFHPEKSSYVGRQFLTNFLEQSRC